jgi:hypothetical protein
MTANHRMPRDWLLVLPLGLFFIAFVGVPLLLVALISLHNDTAMMHFGIRQYMVFFGDSYNRGILGQTRLRSTRTGATVPPARAAAFMRSSRTNRVWTPHGCAASRRRSSRSHCGARSSTHSSPTASSCAAAHGCTFRHMSFRSTPPRRRFRTCCCR